MATHSLLGVDIGGTFTDFVWATDGRIQIHKRLTTPHDPAVSVLDGLAELRVGPQAYIVHGSTIATNALLERRGARTALITTAGFGDVLEIGRQNRPQLYALEPRRPPPLVPARWRFEVHERLDAAGHVLVPVEPAEVDALAGRLRAEDIEAVAVSFLFSFRNPGHERLAGERLRTAFAENELHISLSSSVLPEYREYERTSTTVINAYVAPVMSRYLAHLEAGLAGKRLRVMQSNGGMIGASTAGREAARTALSGPAGGVVGAFHVARLAGFDQVIPFDMGGTSTDVSLCAGRVPLTSEGEIGGLPLRLPILDIHTVGAGGGSLARRDPGGVLAVGPESAGADPGPVCYGRGGMLSTTTDANLVLGRLHADHFLGGRMRLDEAAARRSLAALAASLGMASPEQAAWGVIRVANATMERAIRRISVERGHDPRRFTLVAFGGAGPLHACELASVLAIPRVLVPRYPGVLSALGMVMADLVKDYSQTVLLRPSSHALSELERAWQALEARARIEMAAEGLTASEVILERGLDMRYVGQSFEISLAPLPDPAGLPAVDELIAAFHAVHETRFAYHQPDQPVEFVNVRLKATARMEKPELEHIPTGDENPQAAHLGQHPVWFAGPDRVPQPLQAAMYQRSLLRAGDAIPGPSIIVQLDATTVIAPDWSAQVDKRGNLVLTMSGNRA